LRPERGIQNMVILGMKQSNCFTRKFKLGKCPIWVATW